MPLKFSRANISPSLGLAFSSSTSALALAPNQSTSSIMPSDSPAMSLGHSRSKSVGFIASRNEIEEYDPFRNFVSSTSTQATHSSILLLPEAAPWTSSLQSIPTPLGIPMRVNAPAQPIEAPVMLEVDPSTTDNHIETAKDQSESNSPLHHHEVTAIAKQGKLKYGTGDRDDRDLVNTLSPRPLSFTADRAKIRRKIVLVGDGSCGKSSLIW